jgi:TonB family protein
MRLVVTLFVLTLSVPVWSADPVTKPARITHPASPGDYYPAESVKRREEGAPIVKVCIGPAGKLLRDPVVTETSGFPELDNAAVRLAKSTRYAAGTDESGAELSESCIEYSVTFKIGRRGAQL